MTKSRDARERLKSRILTDKINQPGRGANHQAATGVDLQRGTPLCDPVAVSAPGEIGADRRREQQQRGQVTEAEPDDQDV